MADTKTERGVSVVTRHPHRAVWIIGLWCACGTLAAQTPDARGGKDYFHKQCALCHSAEAGDGGGGQGPDLRNLMGRVAAGDPQFDYTEAMKHAALRWNAESLQKFLAAPAEVVPGTAMLIVVPQLQDRNNLIAYFSGITGKDRQTVDPSAAADRVKAEDEDWRRDRPGRVHYVDGANLPEPYSTGSENNRSRTVPPPPGTLPVAPAGFSVNVFAKGLSGPRRMITAPNGDILLSEPWAGRIRVLRSSKDGTQAEIVKTFAVDLKGPFGLALYPVKGTPAWLYVAETNRVVRYPYRSGDLVAIGPFEVVVPELASSVGGHSSRDLVFSADGRRMFVSVGSSTNVPEDMPRKSEAEIRAWEADHGVGSAWGNEAQRADVLVFDVGADKPARIYATGLRNCVGLALQPKTGSLWCTVNERDRLGDELVPDYSTRVQEGGFYGWPWYYIGAHEDPRFKRQRPDLAGRAIIPDILYQAHSAAHTLTFYAANRGRAAFPVEYDGDAFVAFHGSWNRRLRTGHKIVRVHMRNGVPIGGYEDFLTGFIVDNNSVWGRPVASVVAADGALLVSEDGNGMIYRIAWQGIAKAAH